MAVLFLKAVKTEHHATTLKLVVKGVARRHGPALAMAVFFLEEPGMSVAFESLRFVKIAP